MFFIELMAARFNVFGHQAHDLEATGSSTNNVGHREKYSNSNTPAQSGKLQTLFKF
jgi:zinc transporter 1/2/3